MRKLLTLALPSTAALLAAATASAQFKISINGRDFTAGEEGASAPQGEPSAELMVPNQPLKPGQPFQARLSVRNVPRSAVSQSNEAVKIRWADGRAFETLGGSFNYSNINGVVSQAQVYSLASDAPLTPGTHKIPATTLTFGRVEIQVPEQTVIVRELAAGESPYEKLSVAIETSPEIRYPGQDIPLNLVITESADERLQTITGLAVSGDDSVSVSASSARSEARETEKNGVVSRAIVIPLMARATAAGEIGTRLDVGLIAYTPEGRSIRRELRGIPLRIRVAHAPEAGKPASYRGAIGKFSVSAPEISSKNGKAGEPLQFGFTVTGEGALERVVGPEITSPDWSCREEKPRYGRTTEGKQAKQFLHKITPLYGGELKTPATEFSWFDPSEMKYHTAALPSLTIPVEGPDRPAEKPEANPDTPLLAADPTPTGTVRSYGSLRGSIAFLPVQGFALAALAAAGAVVARIRRIRADPVRMKRIRDLRLLRRRRRDARRALAAGRTDDYAARAREALRAAAALAGSAEHDALTGAEALAVLAVDAGTRDALEPLFIHEERLRYAGDRADDTRLKSTANVLFATLAKAEAAIR